MSSSASCTLKCVPETSHLGDHWAIVVAAYACAFLPLAVIRALDFVTEEWKTIKVTRRTGLIHLFVSLPPLAFVIVYINLQRLMGDYKEMSAGIIVAVFCMIHVFRSVWGLVQLREFKRWNMHALKCLTAMGYNAPRYFRRRNTADTAGIKCGHSDSLSITLGPPVPVEERNWWKCMRWFNRRNTAGISGITCGHSDSSSITSEPPTSEPPIPVEERNWWNAASRRGSSSSRDRATSSESRLRTSFSSRQGRRSWKLVRWMKSLILTFSKMEKRDTTVLQSEDVIEDTIDNHMKVNSSLLDNEFQEAALPAKWDHKSFFRQLSKEPFKAFSVSNHMRCIEPVECSVHWMVSFLCQFGSKWLMDTKNISEKEVEKFHDLKLVQQQPMSLCVLSALHVTQYCRRDRVSLLSLDHLFYSDPMESQNAVVQIGPKCALPYGFRRAPEGEEEIDSIDFEAWSSAILDASSSWDNASLNKLTPEEKQAAAAISPSQLACFSKLIEEETWNTLYHHNFQIDNVNLEKGEPCVETFLEQVGYGPEAVVSNIFESIPTPKALMRRILWEDSLYRNDLLMQTSEDSRYRTGFLLQASEDSRYRTGFLLQASVHVDNWISLEYGADMERLKATLEQRSISFCEQASTSQFHLQKELEMRRLQHKASEAQRASSLSLETARYLGCVTEAVRSFLSTWIKDWEIDPSDAIWKPQGLLETVKLVCSRQLTTSLDAHEKNTEHGTGGLERSVLMRLLWELQSNLNAEVAEKLDRYRQGDLSSSVPLMMLCILGYPSISIEIAEDELRIEQSSLGSSQYDADDEVIRRYKISPVEGPQKLHILLEVRSRGSSKLQLHGDARTTPELYFDWQLWKDAFMGRLSAQSDWRASRLGSDSEMLRREASHSNVTDAFVRKGEEQTGVDYGLTFWSGWPPHLSKISHFELTESPKLLATECPKVSYTGISRPTIRLKKALYPKVSHAKVSHANRKSATRRLEEALNAHFADHQTSTPGSSSPRRAPVPDESRALESKEYRNSEAGVTDADDVRELSTPEMNDVVRRNEALLAMHGLEANPLSHLCLGLCYLRIFYLSGTAFHQLLAANHFKSFALRKREHPVALAIGFLFEHGSFLSEGDDERLQLLWGALKPLEKQPACEQMKALLERYVIEDLSTQQRKSVVTGILKNKDTAAAIYEGTLKSRDKDVAHFASNRLGMLQLRYAIREHTASAEDLFVRTKAEGNIDALCNMAVLQEIQGYRDVAINLLKDKRLKSHSTALNNLAVIYEFETGSSVDTARVKYLYEKAIVKDQNPVAKFNLAILLKSEEDSSRANDILQDLHSQRQRFSRMEVLLKEIDKARAPHMQEKYAPLGKELEEIGQSLAFVKKR